MDKLNNMPVIAIINALESEKELKSYLDDLERAKLNGKMEGKIEGKIEGNAYLTIRRYNAAFDCKSLL